MTHCVVESYNTFCWEFKTCSVDQMSEAHKDIKMF